MTQKELLAFAKEAAKSMNGNHNRQTFDWPLLSILYE
jgi:hypothetical protein